MTAKFKAPRSLSLLETLKYFKRWNFCGRAPCGATRGRPGAGPAGPRCAGREEQNEQEEEEGQRGRDVPCRVSVTSDASRPEVLTERNTHRVLIRTHPQYRIVCSGSEQIN